MKFLWIEPKIAEIKIEMTQGDNKDGIAKDDYSPALCGDLIPCGSCS